METTVTTAQPPKTLRWLSAVLMVMLALHVSPSAEAADPNRDQAEKLVTEGLGFARAGNFAAAKSKFEEAVRLWPHPDIQHNLARAHHKLGEYKSAARYYELAIAKGGNEFSHRKDAQKYRDEVLGELRKTHALLTVIATPSSANCVVKWDDESEDFPYANFSTWVKAGEVRIEGKAPGYKTTPMDLDLSPGEERTIQLQLGLLPKKGYLQVTVNVPGAKVFLNDTLIGKAPMKAVTQDAGIYNLSVKAKGYKAHKQEVIIDSVTPSDVYVVLVASGDGSVTSTGDGGPPGTKTWVGVGLTTLGVGAGVVGGLVLGPVLAKDNSLQGEAFERAQTEEKIGWSLVGGAAALIGAGIVLIAIDEGDGPSSAASFTPELSLTPDHVSVGGTLRF